MTAIESATPRSLGYRMPAEWERHQATWLAWPHNPADWPDKFQPIPWVYCEIVRYLAEVEEVHIAVENASAKKRAAGQLVRVGARLDQVHFHLWPTNRVWTRDSGPIFIRNAASRSQPHTSDGADTGEPFSGLGNSNSLIAITNWKFNAWAKYDNWQLDDQLPLRVAEYLSLPSWTPHYPAGNEPAATDGRVVLEGGSIDVNGAGVLITTEECLLSTVQQRNPGLSRKDFEHVFHDYLAVDQVLWLNRGIAGDDTHGHVDDITRFIGKDTIVTAVEPNSADDNHLPLAENLERLHAARNIDGRPFKIVPLPMPAPVSFEGQRLPASYANFYIANGLVLVPTFNDPNDRKALNILADLFPERKVTGIYAGDLVWGLGTLHCMTQQQPA
jgi:agmatine deiminase